MATEPPGMESLLKQLDDVSHIRFLDSQDQFGMVGNLASQVRDAYAAGCNVMEHGDGELGGIAVAGMGGSAVGGDLIASAYIDSMQSPMATVRGYYLPDWITNRSLVFAVSYSGNTEETISCLGQALERGCRIVAVSAGGQVSQTAHEQELPLIEVPPSLQPRAAMGFLSIPIAACLESLGLVADVEADVQETAGVLALLAELYGPEVPAVENPAKRLAATLYDRIPVIYGSEVTAVAAMRWKTQINENAKTLAFHNEFPELNHNEIVGWGKPADLMERFRVIYLQDEQLHPQNRKRMEVTGQLLEGYVDGIIEHQSSGRSRLARAFSSAYLGDYVSLYLAVLYGLDPSPVERIESLKKRLIEE